MTTNSGTYYLRFLPEDASFATEVLAHNALFDAGVNVPRVIGFEDKNEETGLSFMLVDEIPGICIEDSGPQADYSDILREAGRQLARIHSIPVDGFGWINKGSYDALKGEKHSFDEYFSEHMENDLEALHQYPFSDEERTQIRELMMTARKMLNVEKAVLVHGDFDISHIFHTEGSYSGIIDFGDIRGNNRLYDLATFVGFYQARRLYSYLLEGYCEIAHLTDEDLYATELMALFIILRFLGRKVNSNFREHWYRLARKQLEHINIISN
ncbi:phosphotransferase enzyme family protein [Oceanirhabdus sp. W0125-5]|uniref:phosphotransferase enzyme family protein n=1 Tax=Oceanirhabdus sp. W0125-5 TaxID=2999116 RepID=UPI0022F2D2FB|nr:aminoglycoside phosphotransferase family protein [Oceanirhabdus sp. W0125-5]WBW94992.1 aminoglycoside phosphotransferase family protein [Oceanirhabdus sp. W0125-5]